MFILSCILVFVLGVLTAITWGQRLYSMEQRLPWWSAIWDGTSMLVAYLPLQAWALLDNNFLVIVVCIVGNMVGTYFIVQRKRTNDQIN
jgi:hypothetical protein